MKPKMERTPDDKAVVMTASMMCAESAWEDECQRRVPELAGIAAWEQAESWRDFLKVLDDEDPGALPEILARACEELDETDEYEAAGWIETERGAVFAGFPWDVADDDEDQDDDE